MLGGGVCEGDGGGVALLLADAAHRAGCFVLPVRCLWPMLPSCPLPFPPCLVLQWVP